MSAEVAVRVQNVSKTYRIYDKPEHRLVQMATLGRVRRFKEFSALKDVSLEVRRGETVGIVGRNGCGKSTLLQIICGTLQPSGGHVEVNGRVAALLELGAGFNGEFTGRENVYMNGAILGFSREEMDARFDQIAAFAGIGDFIERPVKTYSSGMFVRLAFAVATAVEPDILIVDEALAVGDEAFQRKCYARIERIKERGGTILFVSHGAQTVVQLCDRAILLDAGERLLEGEPKLVVGQYQKLVNASDETSAKLRQDIKLGRLEGEETTKILSASEELVRQNPIDVFPDSKDESYLDTNLNSESVIAYEERGAKITDIRIKSSLDRPVNVLFAGNRYALETRTQFFADARQVGFGFTIKNTSGLVVAGYHTFSSHDKRLIEVPAGTDIRTCFTFDLPFLPGTYFVTCGVRGTIADEPISLHRIIDAIAFRVHQTGPILAAGLVDLNVNIEQQKLAHEPV